MEYTGNCELIFEIPLLKSPTSKNILSSATPSSNEKSLQVIFILRIEYFSYKLETLSVEYQFLELIFIQNNFFFSSHSILPITCKNVQFKNLLFTIDYLHTIVILLFNAFYFHLHKHNSIHFLMKKNSIRKNIGLNMYYMFLVFLKGI